MKIIYYSLLRYISIVLLFIGSATYALQSDYLQPMAIESESGHVNLKTEKMQIVGNVFVVQGSLKIHGNKITLQKESDKSNIINIYGSPVTFQITLDKKNNLGKNQIFTGTANFVNYNSKKGIVTLIQDAKVAIDKDTIQANKIIYNTITEQCSVTSTSKRRVNMIIYPKN